MPTCKLDLKITNVMKTSEGSDYAGELRLEVPVRITDRLNGAPVDPGTVTDTSVFATVPCTPTADTTLGSACMLSTTVDTLVPNTLLEGWRAVWPSTRSRCMRAERTATPTRRRQRAVGGTGPFRTLRRAAP